jgi:hypothetical protein
VYLRRAGGEDVPDPPESAVVHLPRSGLDASSDVIVFADGDVDRVMRLEPCAGECEATALAPGEHALVMPDGWAAAHGVGAGWTIAIDI